MKMEQHKTMDVKAVQVDRIMGILFADDHVSSEHAEGMSYGLIADVLSPKHITN